MNLAEQQALNTPLSNAARVLYMLGLRPHADLQSGQSAALNYKQLLNLLNSSDEQFTLGRQINALLEELSDAGLVDLSADLSFEQSLNGHCLSMPLMAAAQEDYDRLHMDWRPMHLQWQPDQALFTDLAKLVGIIDHTFSVDELGEFVAYWMGRPQMQFSQFQWTQKFVFQIKQRRLASGVKVLQKVGSQLVEPKASVEADDNAKKLVEKYQGKS